ncbi:HolB ATPase involved in DNA replication [uncultured Caudovirales phage]|uniref:Sliding-clamp-loader large subunit n=1 Tax=uncultured Caudovirales phage TaxID=2100421 RepID=A0A6J5L1P8_9CAUD|nr:HolB ATPase involved in DNA replication [uncultured Caudovirales phage]
MTIQTQNDQFIWEEKYRPQVIDECILPESIKNTFKDFVTKGRLSTMLLAGTAGVGKTTIAKALCNEVGADYIMINGSDEGRKIDTLRTIVKDFASSISLTGAKKVIIVDEADYMNADSVQPALRAFIEEFSNNCSFIFTCNFKNRIIEALHSRCTIVEFKIDPKDKQEMAAQFFKRATKILKQENIEFDPKVVAELVTKHFPDYRRILKELQRYSVSGKIDSGIFVNVSSDSYKELIMGLKNKDFTSVRKWVAGCDSDTTTLFRHLYDNAINILDTSSIPQLVIILGDYQFKGAFVADQEINIMSAMTEIMSSCKFK